MFEYLFDYLLKIIALFEENLLKLSNFSSNINEVMWTVLNFLFVLQKDFARTKKHQKEKKAPKTQKAQKAPKSTITQPSKSTKRK